MGAIKVIGMLLHLNQEERPRSAQGLRDFIHPSTLLGGVKLYSSKACDRNGDTGSQLNSSVWRPGLNFAPLLICCLTLCEVSNTKANKPKPLCAFTQSLVTSAELTPDACPLLFFLSPWNHAKPTWPDQLDFGIRKIPALTVATVSQVTLDKQLNPGFIFNIFIYKIMVKLVLS